MTAEAAMKKRMKVCLLTGSALFMSYVALAGAIADIAEFFPEFSVELIQTGVTAINLMTVLAALFAGWLSYRRAKRGVILFGLAFIVIGGVGGFFFHNTIVLFYLWSLVIGAGLGIFTPTATGLLVDYFEETERNHLIGIQGSFVNGGGVLLAFVGGLLAAIVWNCSYLAFLAAIPVFILYAKSMPVKKSKDTNTKPVRRKIPGCVLYYLMTSFIFMLVYNAFPSNIALFVSERGIGDASLAGSATSVFMLGGVFFGFIYSKFSVRIGEYLFTVGHLTLALSFFLLYLTESVGIVFVVAFFGGMSINMTMPQTLFSVSTKIPPETGITVFSLVMSVTPNIATFISPAVISFLSKLVSDAGDSVSRFVAAGLLSLCFAVVQFAIVARSRRVYKPR